MFPAAKQKDFPFLLCHPAFCPEIDSSETGRMRIISQGRGHALRLIEARRPSSSSESIFIRNSRNIKSGLTGSMMRACGGCNVHGSGA